MHKRFDGFAVNLFLDEDSDWLVHFVELPQISAFGNSPEKALAELDIAWELVKESYIEMGKSIPKPLKERNYSGQFNVRIDKRDHQALVAEAVEAGLTLNALVAQMLHDAAQARRPRQGI